jgi:hypothetical protein
VWYPWFFDALARTHVPVASYEDASWKLTRYELRDVAKARRDGNAIRR